MRKIDINLRSEEINDILSRVPLWLVRWGTTIFFFLLISVICLFSIITLPSKINGAAIVVETGNTSNLALAAMEVRQENLQSIKIGQPVLLHLKSFSSLKYGTIRGALYQIGDTVNKDGNFHVEIAIPRVKNSAVFHLIKKNMSGNAEIITGEESIIKGLLLNGF